MEWEQKSGKECGAVPTLLYETWADDTDGIDIHPIDISGLSMCKPGFVKTLGSGFDPGYWAQGIADGDVDIEVKNT